MTILELKDIIENMDNDSQIEIMENYVTCAKMLKITNIYSGFDYLNTGKEILRIDCKS